MPPSQIDLGAYFRGQVLRVADEKAKPLGRPPGKAKIKQEPEAIQEIKIEEVGDCDEVSISKIKFCFLEF